MYSIFEVSALVDQRQADLRREASAARKITPRKQSVVRRVFARRRAVLVTRPA